MATIKITDFAGVAPRWSARLLPNNGAVNAENAKLLSGELRGLHETQLLYDFSLSNPPDPIVRAFRLPQNVSAPIPISDADQWIGFTSTDVDFVRTPVLEDSFERYYWTSDPANYSAVPQYNTRARIDASSPSFVLGIPTPVNAVTIVPAAGTNLTRAYVYTFISAYGEEGPPSPPSVATGTNGTWTISGWDTTIPNQSNYNIATVRLYRTVAGTTETEYYWVADLTFGSSTPYNDTQLDQNVALNFTLPSLTWVPPPSDLKGLVAHPGGFLVGFSGRDLCLSEPYQPHAWPLQYVSTLQTEIVGIAIFNNCIVVMTTSHPYVGSGMTPLTVTLQKLDSIDPCVSRRSIATTLNGVYYASPQGVILNDSTQSYLTTEQLFTREEWQDDFSPTSVLAAPYGLQYIAFDTSASGFIFSPADQHAPLTTLDRFSGVSAIQIDAYSGDVYLVQNDQVRLWDPPTSIPYEYTWTSKEFDLPKPVNFGAMRLKFVANPINVSISDLGDYTTFNDGRITKPLNCVGLAVMGGVRTAAVTGYTQPQIKNPLGGSPLFNIASLTTQESSVVVNIYARDLDSTWNLQYSESVVDERIRRLPAGFKSDIWQVEFVGNANVYSFAMAETAKELSKV
jgi:hypothetical protein